MRVTNNLLIDRFLRMHQEIMESIEKATYQISTGKRLEYPSDDPSGTSQILSLKRSIEEMNRFLDNIDLATNWLNAADTTFDKLDGYVSRVRELAVQGANDTQNEESRDAIAKELNQIFQELLDIGNTNSMGRYIFAGTKTDVKPFAYNKYNSVRIAYVPDDIASGTSLEASEAFSDLYQLETGHYRLFIKREGKSSVKLWLENEAGQIVQIDSNGSDESGTGANVFADRAVFSPSEINGKIYGTFDTGRGIKINLKGLSLDTLNDVKVIEFDYTKGGEISYNGNDEEQPAQVGYNNQVAMNIPGEGLFKPSHRTLAAQSYERNLTEALPLDRMGLFTGATFEVDGTTHDGRKAGAAVVVSPKAIDFNGLGSNTGSLTLDFYINESGMFVTAQITLDLPAHYETVDELVDVLKAQLDANSKLRNRVEVGAQGDHVVFYLTEPGANYLYVKEEDTDSLGFGDGVGFWGSNATYVVSQRIYGRAVSPLTASETFTVTTLTGNVTVTTNSTDSTPLYTVEKVEPRLFEPISSGSTVEVKVGTASYTFTFNSAVTTLNGLVEVWNDPTNWTASAGATVPPVAMVQESETGYRLVSLVDTSEINFQNGVTGAETLYKLGLASAGQDTFVLKNEPYMRMDEYTALRVAYSIKKTLPRDTFKVYTDGSGGLEVIDEKGKFTFDFPAGSKIAQIFC